MAIVISTICSKTNDVRVYRPIEGNVKLGEKLTSGEYAGSISEVIESDCSSTSKSKAQKCMLFSEASSGVHVVSQVTEAKDGGMSSTPYTQQITSIRGVY